MPEDQTIRPTYSDETTTGPQCGLGDLIKASGALAGGLPYGSPALGFAVCPGSARQGVGFDGIIFARQLQVGEQVNNAVIGDKVHPLRIQTYEVSAVLAILVAHAGLHAEQVRIGAIGALAQRDADLRDRNAADAANGEEIRARLIIFATFQTLVVFPETEYPASHEDMGMRIAIGLNFLKAFIDPMDAVSTINHSANNI